MKKLYNELWDGLWVEIDGVKYKTTIENVIMYNGSGWTLKDFKNKKLVK